MASEPNSLCETKEELELKGVSHSMSYCEESRILLLCDSFHWTVEQYNVTASGLVLSEEVELTQRLSNPTSVHIAPKVGLVFVGCDSDEGVYVFDRKFQLIKKFAQNMKMDFNNIAVADEAKQDIKVYMTSVNSDKLTKWDYNSGSLLSELPIAKPENITLKDDKLYLICRVDSTECILIINTHTLEILSKIAENGWSKFGGLCIDESGFIMTSACRLVNGSLRRSIFTVNSEGNFVSQFLLDFEECGLVSGMVRADSDFIILTQEPGPEFILKRIGLK